MGKRWRLRSVVGRRVSCDCLYKKWIAREGGQVREGKLRAIFTGEDHSRGGPERMDERNGV